MGVGPLILVDTSAFVCVLNRAEERHAEAARMLASMRATDLVTTNYIVTETASVLDRRFPPRSVAAFLDDVIPMIRVEWIERGIHDRGIAAFRAKERRRLSFVDATTIEFCRDRGIKEVFAFDDDLEVAGIKLVKG